MTELYRGLLRILVMYATNQIESLRSHIRSYNSGHGQIDNFDIGVTGFWNLMLEIVFTIFVILFLMSGVILTASLAIIAYPFAALVNYVAWVFGNVKNPSGNTTIIVTQNNEQEKK